MTEQKIIGKGTWIDKLAHELIEREKQLGRKTDLVRVESGLGASGIPHIGSLGDAVRAYGVKLALENLGYKSELIAYSDDLDGLRKIPEGLTVDSENIGKRVSSIPDPVEGCKHNSYGEHMSSLLLDGLDDLGIEYVHKTAHETYKNGLLVDQIHKILVNSKKIGDKIEEMTGQQKFQSVIPYFPICDTCDKLYTTESFEYIEEEKKIRYRCKDSEIGSNKILGCGHEGESDITKGLGKLAWKVEFAARWSAFDIRFEAYGKDIMDSVKVNDWVADEILEFPHPHHVKYEMFLDKGGKKISKSLGNVVTSQRWLTYGTPESILLLLYKRITGARELGFEDIPGLMDEYNELENIYFGKTKVDNEAKLVKSKGLYEYVSEVLISYFGSFEKTIKKISELKKGQVIGKSTKKFDSPVVIIDPVDNNRNLGTAISMDNLGRFVLASRAFLKKPSKKFFKKPISKRIMKNNDKIVVVQFRFKDRSDDIIWGQIKRASNALKTQLELGGFTVLRNSSAKDEKENAALIFLLHAKKIESNLVRSGPEISSKEHCEKFIAANLKKSQLMWINNEGKIQSLQKRKHDDVKLFLRDILKNNLKNSGIPKGLEKDFKKGVKIIDANKVSTKSIKEAIANVAITDETIFR